VATVGQAARQHPIAAAALGAGVTLLAAQAVRMALQARAGEAGDLETPRRRGHGGRGGRGEGFTDRLTRLGSKMGSAFQDTGEALRRGARSGFEGGREAAEEGWDNHPFMLCGAALALGVLAGYAFPITKQEERLMGLVSEKVTGPIRTAGQNLLEKGRAVAGRVVQGAVDATEREAEREGLTPARLGRKVKRALGNVRQAVSEAIEEE
jgi:hypothetical protein